MKEASDRKSKTIIEKINLSSFQKWYLFSFIKKINWFKSNIHKLIFCENVGEFIKESVTRENAPQLIETGPLFRVQFKLPNNFIYKMCSGRSEDVHVSGHNLRTRTAMKLSYGILDCP